MASVAPAPSSATEAMAAIISLRFLFHWLGVLCYLFAPVSFLVTKDWKKVFYDCFGPEVLVADTFTIVITLWYHIFGPRKTDESIVSIIGYAIGLGMKVMSICLFAMYHSLCGGIEKAKYWFYAVFGAFGIVTLLTFMWLEMGITIDKSNDGRAYFGYFLAAVAEIFQVAWPAIIRMAKKNFVNDEKPIFWLKISAATMTLSVSCSDLWHMIKENYWASDVERRFMVLTMINIIGCLLQLVARYIGPEWFAEPVVSFKNQCHLWGTEKWTQCKSMYEGWNV